MAKDLDKLQGKWHLTSLETDGQVMPGDSFGGAIVITGKRFVSLGMGASYEGTLELDDKKTPKTFQLLFTVGHAAGTRNLGIYKLDGETWTMCLATRGTVRPRSFSTKPGTGYALQTLERGAAPKKKSAKKAMPTRGQATSAPPPELTSLGARTAWEGEWEMVSAVFNGAAMADDMVKWCKRITRGNVTAVMAGPQVMLKASFVLDDSKTPPAVDYVNLEGSNARKPQAGIFSLRGDELKICMAAPGNPRPADFASKPKDGRSYTTWRLIKK